MRAQLQIGTDKTLLTVAKVVRQSVSQLQVSFLKILMIWLKSGAQSLKSMFNGRGSNSTVDEHLSPLDITQSKMVYIVMNISEKHVASIQVTFLGFRGP
jgi:hypothetical protein